MTIHRILRLAAGTLVLGSLALAHFVAPQWLWLTAFVGANLVQSAFTDWCPAVWILQRLGFQRAGSCCSSKC